MFIIPYNCIQQKYNYGVIAEGVGRYYKNYRF